VQSLGLRRERDGGAYLQLLCCHWHAQQLCVEFLVLLQGVNMSNGWAPRAVPLWVGEGSVTLAATRATLVLAGIRSDRGLLQALAVGRAGCL